MRTRVVSVEAAGQVYNQTNVFVYLGGKSTTLPTCPSRSTGAYATHGAASENTPSNSTTDRALPLIELKIRMLRAELLETMLYSCVTWSPRASHYDSLRRAHYSFLTGCIGRRKSDRADHLISYLDTFVEMVPNRVACEMVLDGAGQFIPAGIDDFHT